MASSEKEIHLQGRYSGDDFEVVADLLGRGTAGPVKELISEVYGFERHENARKATRDRKRCEESHETVKNQAQGSAAGRHSRTRQKRFFAKPCYSWRREFIVPFCFVLGKKNNFMQRTEPWLQAAIQLDPFCRRCSGFNIGLIGLLIGQ